VGVLPTVAVTSCITYWVFGTDLY